eukprot:3940254-Rhodomonas_salina.6
MEAVASDKCDPRYLPTRVLCDVRYLPTRVLCDVRYLPTRVLCEPRYLPTRVLCDARYCAISGAVIAYGNILCDARYGNSVCGYIPTRCAVLRARMAPLPGKCLADNSYLFADQDSIYAATPLCTSYAISGADIHLCTALGTTVSESGGAHNVTKELADTLGRDYGTRCAPWDAMSDGRTQQCPNMYPGPLSPYACAMRCPAMSGTDIAYAYGLARRCPVLTYHLLSDLLGTVRYCRSVCCYQPIRVPCGARAWYCQFCLVSPECELAVPHPYLAVLLLLTLSTYASVCHVRYNQHNHFWYSNAMSGTNITIPGGICLETGSVMSGTGFRSAYCATLCYALSGTEMHSVVPGWSRDVRRVFG